jgi:Ca2+-binding RTX toxin-like protein
VALQVFGTNSIGLNTQAQLSTTDDALIVAGVTVASTNGYGVFGSGNGHIVNVQGTVAGVHSAIWLGNGLDNYGQHVVIGEDGYAANTSLVDAAVTVRSTLSRVDNAGTIHGEAIGLRIGGVGSSNWSTITNSGLIEGGTVAIQRFQGSADRLEVHNSGEIRALDGAPAVAFHSAGQASDYIYNSGLVVGSIFLGEGNDIVDNTGGQVIGTVLGEAGADLLTGGSASDNLLGGSDNDILSGGAGDDHMSGDSGDDFLFGGEGSDFLTGAADIDRIDGGAGDDSVDGGTGNDIISGGAGNDSLSGYTDADRIDGGAGNDTVDGGTGGDTMSGGAGNDVFFVESAVDVVSEVGGSGVDTVSSLISFNFSDAVHARGALENLTLTGNAAVNGAGNALANTITGNIAANILSGLAGNDVLNGGAGGDRLLGSAGNDVLKGQDGLDRLHGGAGKDTLTGGTGADSFVFDTAANSAANRDVVTDFVHGQDKFLLENAVFAKLGAPGTLNAGAFHVGTAAHDNTDRIVYNKATGVLSYDADGDGTLPAVQFAVLSNKAVLTASDFVVV